MDEMRSGRWQYNGEAIKWSVDDVLLDGQHRLTALSRMPDDFPALPFLVVRGLPTASQDTMDQGRTRSAGDQLNIDGLIRNADSKVIAGAIRVYIDWQGGGLFRDRASNRVSNPMVIEWAQNHPIEISIMTAILGTEMRRVKARPSLTLAVLLHFHLIDGEAAREFCAGLYTGVGLSAGNPILALRDRLDRISTQGFKSTDRDTIGLFVLAWNAWRNDRKLTKFQRPAGGSWTRDTFPEAV
ncbi:hypothetical protein I3U42_08620 [Mycobacteroides abscessus subsp. abscessus]|nr:hypothetical protein BAB77_08785 [Mycobacteroides abscessus]MBN7396314.1 hypothetical protein [Mycobacteroides abscessus subsp. abscessus]MBN7567262.1 hypothetical protein [Mycobacteroides abscessus subsp. massiliense]OHU68067.1 hypothetical protein BKG87_22370 [Mycobacteroides chelonae]MDM2055411.1 hypothetical protein [Mycobacteroides abscessus]